MPKHTPKVFIALLIFLPASFQKYSFILHNTLYTKYIQEQAPDLPVAFFQKVLKNFNGFHTLWPTKSICYIFMFFL